MNKNFFKNNVLILFIANSANVFAYLFQFLMARSLSVIDFGILSSISAFAVTITMFFGITPYLVSKYLIQYKFSKEIAGQIFYKLNTYTVFSMTLIIFLLLFFQSQFLISFGLVNTVPFYLMLLFVMTSIILNTHMGIFQAEHKYILFSTVGSVNQLLKLMVAAILVLFIGLDYNGALLSLSIANVLVWIYIYRVTCHNYKLYRISFSNIDEKIIKEVKKDAIRIGSTLLLFALFTNIDLVIIKHYIESEQVGIYSVASILAKIIIFLPSILIHVLFPQIVSDEHTNNDTYKTLFNVLILTIMIVISYIIIIIFFNEYLITLLFGEKYNNASQYVVIVSIAMGIISIVNVLLNYFVAKNKSVHLYFNYMILLVLFATIVTFKHNTINDIVESILIGSLITLLTNFIILYYLGKGEK